MKKINRKLGFIMIALIAVTFAQDAKIDSLYKWNEQMYKEQRNDPLANKKMGIEANLLRLLFIDETVSISGGFSLFNITRQAEVAFPLFYNNPNDGVSFFTADCHYRHFLGNTQNGFYLSGFTRYANLSGHEKIKNDGINDDDFWYEDSEKGEKITRSKFGVGVGLGYRKFSKSGLYWGCSLNLGRYIIGENEVFYEGPMIDQKFIVNVEFLKFGFAF
ncbi:MAG: hypothetical protein JXQ65_00525 [Candidatus Marinimicrobia bacterium]|nr:hypothetical protein [Candidatus Neomarinimicrobiota bacterium]